MGWWEYIQLCFPSTEKSELKPNHPTSIHQKDKIYPPNFPASEYLSLTPKSREILCDIRKTLSSPSAHVTLTTVGVLSFLLGYRVAIIRKTSLTRFFSASDIPSSAVGPNTDVILRGRIVSCSDGDTVRFLHLPTILHPSRVPHGSKLSAVTIPVRLCTIDTPEVSKFGQPGQPYGIEATNFLRSIAGDKVAFARILAKDQYGRAVAELWVRRFFFFSDLSR
mmetsp:Transcript_36858/g.86094  ORF Transcript_36858/g.86094 Transcript_36858/m.86094 type:complete len:222 (+) Transcript_36858:170-835(+)